MSTSSLTLLERVNFLLTNRVPRYYLTLFVGWLSKIENPVISSLSIFTWRLFVDDLRLEEAEKSSFKSMHDCFTRRLKPGARPIDTAENVLVSPCDAVVGEFGKVRDCQVLQAKGFPYSIKELIDDEGLAATYSGGHYITLRLKSSMYHRFHAPCDAHARSINYISGDTWNVNPVALKCIESLFCRNERIVLQLHGNEPAGSILLVPVAAILVASMRIHGLSEPFNLKYRGANVISCDLNYSKGDEIGYFEHGSTIIMFTGAQWRFDDALKTGTTIRMGQRVMTVS